MVLEEGTAFINSDCLIQFSSTLLKAVDNAFKLVKGILEECEECVAGCEAAVGARVSWRQRLFA